MKTNAENPLKALLCEHPQLAPSEDRLTAVLAQSTAAKKPPSPARNYPAWLSGLAASIALGFAIFTAQERPTTAPRQPFVIAQIATDEQRALAELAALMADSKALESSLQNMGSSRARISQMQSLGRASAQIAQLDSQLDFWVNAEPNNLAKQSALWRERVTVMHAVEKGEFNPALFLVD